MIDKVTKKKMSTSYDARRHIIVLNSTYYTVPILRFIEHKIRFISQGIHFSRL